jgi:putative lipoic acid-binding regulatory protein
VPIDWGNEAEKTINDKSDKLNVNGYKIEIELENEEQQEQLYNKLTEEGYQCRILTL